MKLRFIKWIVKILCPGFHVAKNPAGRRKAREENARLRIYTG